MKRKEVVAYSDEPESEREQCLDMTTRKSYIHPQNLQDIVLQKRKQVAKLQEQYKLNEIKTTNNSTTIEDLNYKYLALKSENEVLKGSQPNVIPRCKTLLFEWTVQKLQDDIRNLQELIEFQKNMKKISYEKELELRKISFKDYLNLEEMKENENFRSDVLICLHQKLIRRLGKITKEYFPAITNSENQVDGDLSKKNKKSLFKILQALFPDFKDNTLKPNEFEKIKGSYIKKSYPKEYLDLLISSKIIYFDDEEPNFMKIIAE